MTDPKHPRPYADLIQRTEEMLEDTARRRDELREMWAQVMIYDEGVEEVDLHPIVVLQRQQLREAAELLDETEKHLRRFLEKARAGEAVDAALLDIVDRYTPPKFH